jgi:hypothetical protein
MGLAADTGGNGSNEEGGTEGLMHKSGPIIAVRPRCARHGAWNNRIKEQGPPRVKSHRPDLWEKSASAYFFIPLSNAMNAVGPPSR